MATSDELTEFVREALTRGLPRPQIEDALTGAGWSPAQARDALAAFSDGPFPIPVPRPRPYVDAREAFLYLSLFVAMYVSMANLGTILFQLINRSFPEPHDSTITLGEAVRWPVSVLIVAVPLFLYLTWLVNRDIRQDPAKRASPVRRKLTYLTLFTAGGAIIGVITCVIYEFLGGELTIRFILKLLTVGVIAGTVFGYYERDLREERLEGQRLGRSS